MQGTGMGVKTILMMGMVLLVGWLVGCGGETNSTAANGGEVAGAGAAAEQPAVHPGAQIYRESCSSCHAPGLSGAPKFGDAEAWAPRIAKGRDLLLQTTIEGIPPAMPPRGICMHCTDEQLADAIDYMIVNSQ